MGLAWLFDAPFLKWLVCFLRTALRARQERAAAQSKEETAFGGTESRLFSKVALSLFLRPNIGAGPSARRIEGVRLRGSLGL